MQQPYLPPRCALAERFTRPGRCPGKGRLLCETALPFGTEEDVRREVEGLITVLGKNDGCILGPSHAIQVGTPPEKVVAMFGTALILIHSDMRQRERPELAPFARETFSWLRSLGRDAAALSDSS